MNVQDYLNKLNTRFKTGISTEHSYRGDLQNLLENLTKDVLVTNEPSRIECGAPDYILTKKSIPVGYIEAKDIGADLNSNLYKEQINRYRHSLNNLIVTDYLTFQLFRDGNKVTTLSIGQAQGNRIKGIPENYDPFIALIVEFCTYAGQTITSASKLSKMMAGKARLLADVIEKALAPREQPDQVNEPGNITLQDQYISFKQILIHDITEKSFADIYSQTIAYGLFAARLNDPTLEDFSRQEAATLIPKSNPFLRKLFQYIAGYDLDDRIKWIVEALVDVFRATNVAELLKDFGKATQQNDPMVHFYETFLAEYDPALRKSRGVWYTPEPVVNFIVRAVDDILKDEFGLPNGLADNSKVRVKFKVPTLDKRMKVDGQKGYTEAEQEVHKVQILDPAAGTGTFLAEVVKLIHHHFEGQQGIWNNYVENHLIPRLNGFEILMASYAMAHLKLDLLLKETGFVPTRDQRFKVYLTNSLEEYHPDTGTLFAHWLSTEANEANYIKRDTPVMIVLGNPPYSGESSNKGEWIMRLMEDYKKEPGGKEKLHERNPKWINDDYVKFLRYGQHLIEKNGSGILAFINPHGFLDNPTFRGMRWNLLKTYDKIFTLDLHGNSKKKETSPGGSVDQNVFDIMQGVSINLLIKSGLKKSNALGQVFHFDLFGPREYKYGFLLENSINTIKYQEIPNKAPMFFMVRKNFDIEEVYQQGFKVDELFPSNSVGIVTARDDFSIRETKEDIQNTILEFLGLEDEAARKRFNLGKDVRDWQVNFARKDLEKSGPNFNNIVKISYRPFDEKYTYFTGKSKGFHCYPRAEVMKQFLSGNNVSINLCKQFKSGDSYQHVFISNKIVESSYVSNRTSEITSIFPLYIYSEIENQLDFNQINARKPNFNAEIIKQVEKNLVLKFISEETNRIGTFAPIDILDYIYAILHCPSFRVKYKEFLKIDFPRVPYPKDQETFWQLVKLGGELRKIHLLESPVVERRITTYPKTGTNKMEKLLFEITDGSTTGKVWINDEQYFDGVPKIAWEFFIGGYQPAQKWLKDRKGRELSFEDILHYQKIIVALTETNRIMEEIDKIEIELKASLS